MNAQSPTVVDETLRILLVDDEAIARLTLSRPLQQLGHTIVSASGGNEAIALLESQNFDLVLLDLEMLEGDGFDVLHHIQAHPLSRWMPVIVTSGHQAEAEVAKALALGADDYMIKPVNLGYLRYKLRNFQRAIVLQKQNLALLRNVTEKNRELENWKELEFEYSTRIQKTLVYGNIPPMPGGIHTSGLAQASQGINGDFIEVISIYPNTVDLIIGDVMGKGPLAAILAADVKLHVKRQIISNLVTNGGVRFSVAEIVNGIHHALTSKLIELESFVTLLYARIDRTSGELTVTCCGHPQPWVISPDACHAVGHSGLPLGILQEEVYEEHTCPLGPGSAVLAFSDGLSDVMNAQGMAYGDEQQLRDIHRFQVANWGANALAEMAFANALQYANGVPLRDDLTILVAKLPAADSSPQRTSLPRKLNAVGALRQFVSQFSTEQQLPDPLADSLALVAVEAFTNTVRHSKSPLRYAAVEVQLERHANQISMSLEAPGPEFVFAPTSLSEIDPNDLSREGGFGLPIMRALATRCVHRHTDGVNRLDFEFDVV